MVIHVGASAKTGQNPAYRFSKLNYDQPPGEIQAAFLWFEGKINSGNDSPTKN